MNVRNDVEREGAVREQLQLLQRDVLEALVEDVPLHDVSDLICRRVEELIPDVVCTIIQVDENGRLRPLAAPSLPGVLASALDGLRIGPAAGACGTAAFRQEPVVVEDITSDPLWDGYRWLPLPRDLVACWSSPVTLRDGRVAGTFAFYFRDHRGPSEVLEEIVTACIHLCALAIERHEAKVHIARLAYFDPLTLLPNRARLRHQVTEYTTGSVRQFALLFLDIDNFKDINDSLGHSFGDELLREIARRLQQQVRQTDTVSRIGGDEFVIVVPDCDADQAAAIADKLLDHLAAPVQVGGTTVPVSSSIGISLYPRDGTDEETLLKHADTAMYRAKAGGRGTYRFFRPEMNRQAQVRLTLGTALRTALANGGLRLHFQPQIRLSDNSLYGVEALARWWDPDHGDVAPEMFVSVAEHSGLTEALNAWSLRAALRQLADWRARGLQVPAVSVNVSPLQFRDRRLPKLVVEALTEHRVPPSALVLEITEGMMMQDHVRTVDAVGALWALGVRLSMDDFGTGYSSLSRLAELPLAELKIDSTFMSTIERDASGRAVADAVVRIGQSLGMTVVAEGVETEEQLKVLRDLNCHVAQGFVFTRALPADEFETWLADFGDGARYR